MNNNQLSNNLSNSFTSPKEEYISVNENSFLPISVENGHGFYLIPPVDSRFSTSIKVVENPEKLEIIPYDLYAEEKEDVITLASIISADISLKSEDTLGEESNAYCFDSEDIELLKEIDCSPYECEEFLICIVDFLENNQYYNIWSTEEAKYIHVKFTAKECVNLIYKLNSEFRGAIIIDALTEINSLDFQSLIDAFKENNSNVLFKTFKNIISYSYESNINEEEWY